MVFMGKFAKLNQSIQSTRKFEQKQIHLDI